MVLQTITKTFLFNGDTKNILSAYGISLSLILIGSRIGYEYVGLIKTKAIFL